MSDAVLKAVLLVIAALLVVVWVLCNDRDQKDDHGPT